MDRNSRYFYASGAISLSLFAIIVSLFIFMITSEEVKHFALTKDNYISVSVDMSLLKSRDLTAKNTTKEESSPKEVDIDDLFSDLWTQGVKEQKDTQKITSKRRLEEIKRKIKSSDVKSVESISKIVQNIDSKELSEDSSKKSTALEVNKYLAKIQALVYNYFYPPPNSQGNSVKAIIELSAIGKVIDFRILTYSSNKYLNDECDKIKDRLMNVVFPENPDKTSGTYTITLISEE